MNPFVILPGGKRCAVGSRDPCNLYIYIYIYFFTSELVRPRFFLTLYIRLCCEVWTGNLTDPPDAVAPLLA